MHVNIGIIGSRSRNSEADFKILVDFLEDYLSILEKGGHTFSFVSGGCPKGGDHFAEIIAKELNIPIQIFYPDVKDAKSKGEYAKACYARNLLIAKHSNELIALPNPEKKSGTLHTITNFTKMHGKNAIII